MDIYTDVHNVVFVFTVFVIDIPTVGQCYTYSFNNDILIVFHRYSNREEFVGAVRELRLRELACSERMKTVRCGLASVIPLELLGVLTAEDLDLRVCGLPQIDLEYLKVGIACVLIKVW